MNCQFCRTRVARVKISGALGTAQVAMHLCDACAAAHRLNPEALDREPLAAFLGRCAELGEPRPENIPDPALTCPDCGRTWPEYEESGLLGCPCCYTAFQSQIQGELREAAQGLSHRGKGGLTPPVESLPRLQRRLQRAIEREAYEEAARLRDRIRELRQAESKPTPTEAPCTPPT